MKWDYNYYTNILFKLLKLYQNRKNIKKIKLSKEEEFEHVAYPLTHCDFIIDFKKLLLLDIVYVDRYIYY